MQDIECGICFKKFQRKSSLVRHMATVHSIGVRHVCHECGRIFPYGARLKDHYRSRHEVNIHINWHMWVDMICRQGYRFFIDNRNWLSGNWQAVSSSLFPNAYTRDRCLYLWAMEYLLHSLSREERNSNGHLTYQPEEIPKLHTVHWYIAKWHPIYWPIPILNVSWIAAWYLTLFFATTGNIGMGGFKLVSNIKSKYRQISMISYMPHVYVSHISY